MLLRANVEGVISWNVGSYAMQCENERFKVGRPYCSDDAICVEASLFLSWCSSRWEETDLKRESQGNANRPTKGVLQLSTLHNILATGMFCYAVPRREQKQCYSELVRVGRGSSGR